MSGKYLDNSKEIFCLIDEGRIDELKKKYPKVIDHLDFLRFMIFSYENNSCDMYWFSEHDFRSCLMVCEELKDKTEMIYKEKDLIKAIMNNYDLHYWLRVLFNPEFFIENDLVGYAASSINDMYFYEYDKVLVENDRIREFFQHMKNIREKHSNILCSSVILNLIFFYCYMNNNYDYLYEYVSNDGYYNDKIKFNYSADNLMVLYDNLDKVFIKPRMIIK